MGETKLGRNSVFTLEQEGSVAKHVMLLAKMFHDLNPVQLRHIVFDFAEKVKSNNFNRQSCTAGKKLAV